MIKISVLVCSLLVGVVQASDPRETAAVSREPVGVHGDLGTVDGYKATLLEEMRAARDRREVDFMAVDCVNQFGEEIKEGLSPRELAVKSINLNATLAFTLFKQEQEMERLASHLEQLKQYAFGKKASSTPAAE